MLNYENEATITSYKIISIKFVRNWFQFINGQSKYMIVYEDSNGKNHKIYYPRKQFIQEIFYCFLYVPNFNIQYIKQSFEKMSEYLINGKQTLFFDIWRENGEIKYIRVSKNTPFTSNIFDIFNSPKNEWISTKINTKSNFIKCIRNNL